MSIAPDLDKLMWNIADRGEKEAAESFQNRFPELKHELEKRMKFVRDIKKAKQLHAAAMPRRPEFRVKPRGESAPFKPSGRLVTATAITLCAAIVFAASYSLLRSQAQGSGSNGDQSSILRWRNQVPERPGAPFSSSMCPQPDIPGHNVFQRTPINMDQKPEFSPQPSKGQNGAEMPLPSLDKPEQAAAPGISSPRGQRIIMKQVPLSSALQAISAQYGLKIETAPGFPDPTIVLDSQDKGAVAMLRDIGSKYNFGVVEEGDKAVLLVPLAKP